MEEERYQKELFELKAPKRAFPGFRKLHIKSDFAVTLNLEKLIFVSIAVVMLLVVVYAMGVERGKARPGPLPGAAPAAPTAQIPPAVQPQARLTGIAAPQMNAPAQPQSKMAAPNAVATGPSADTSGPYTVLAVTLRRREGAAAEAERLKKTGLDAFVRQSGEYFQVCAGSYANRASAEKASLTVRRLYRDAYVIMK